MEQVIKEYGVFFLEGLILLMVWFVCIFGITDSEGNTGIFHMVGKKLPEERVFLDNFGEFQNGILQESGKHPPTICGIERSFRIGQINLAEAILATDYSGNILPVEVLSVKNSNGIEILESPGGTAEITITVPGIYTITVYAVDAGLRNTTSCIKIPVNR